jgi:peptidoglycan/xylan/chitin deacetylase (PgdA/CDA1 family)
LLLACALLAGALTPAAAESCPGGRPDALGTSRTLVVDPAEHTRIGTMQYRETLPLQDHEVVLTFDDGPLPPHSGQVLETLASECVKATFFIIGRMAKQFPDGVRKMYDAGHTIGTHSENHPLSFHTMPIERAKQEIEDGIAHTAAALGDPAKVAPFFRIPGLLRADGVEAYAASRGLMTWSADFPADDWRHISPQQVLNYALTRLEAKGKGVLLLHDIQGRTASMLPTLLRELKARGYRVVHVVPAAPGLPKTPTEPRDWLMHPDAGLEVANWPPVPSFVFPVHARMPAPGLSPTAWLGDLRERDNPLLFRPTRADTVRKRTDTAWPRPQPMLAAAAVLPAPDRGLFRMQRLPSRSRVTTGAALHAEAQPAEPAVPIPAATTQTVKVQTVPALAVPARTVGTAPLNAAMRPLPGSWPVTVVGLQRGAVQPR